MNAKTVSSLFLASLLVSLATATYEEVHVEAPAPANAETPPAETGTIEGFVNKAVDALPEGPAKQIVQQKVEKVLEVKKPIIDIVDPVAENVQTATQPAVDAVKTVTQPGVDTVMAVVDPVVTSVTEVTGPIVVGVQEFTAPAIQNAQDIAAPAIQTIQTAAKPVTDAIETVTGTVTGSSD